MKERGTARDFDFWIGEWDVFGPQGRQVGTNSITRLFDGSARPVMAHLVEMGKISREDIEDAQKLLREHNARDPSSKDKLK